LLIGFGGTVLPTGTTTIDLKANQEYTVGIETHTDIMGFKGFLVRAEGVNGEDRSSSFEEFTFFHPTLVPELRIDVPVTLIRRIGLVRSIPCLYALQIPRLEHSV